MTTVLMIPNSDKKDAIQGARQFSAHLAKLGGRVVSILEYQPLLQGVCDGFYPAGEALERADMVICIGGDGTIIRSAKLAISMDKPILGINSGRLGFLAAAEANEQEKLTRLLQGDYSIENRMMLEVLVHKPQGIERFVALNDAVVSKGHIAKIIDLTVTCGGKLIGSYNADGLIFSTPTGSTAYNLSAGGPIMDPSLESIIMSPICPHTLAARTIVFSSGLKLEVIPGRLNDGKEAFLTVDGSEFCEVGEGDVVVIQKAKQYCKFISFGDKAFYEIVNQKIKGKG